MEIFGQKLLFSLVSWILTDDSMNHWEKVHYRLPHQNNNWFIVFRGGKHNVKLVGFCF